jgi:MoxR-like ATPase
LITAPAAPGRTTASAHRLPEALFDRFSTRVALDYLRARYQQGARLRLVAQEVRQAEPHRWIVTVLVSALDESGAPTHEARFAVSLMQEADGALRVDGVSEAP